MYSTRGEASWAQWEITVGELSQAINIQERKLGALHLHIHTPTRDKGFVISISLRIGALAITMLTSMGHTHPRISSANPTTVRGETSSRSHQVCQLGSAVVTNAP